MSWLLEAEHRVEVKHSHSTIQSLSQHDANNETNCKTPKYFPLKKSEPLHIPWPKGLSLHDFVGCYEVMNSALENSQQNSSTLPFLSHDGDFDHPKSKSFLVTEPVTLSGSSPQQLCCCPIPSYAYWLSMKSTSFHFFSSELLVRPNVWVIVVKTRTVEQLIIQLKCFQGFEYFVGNDH